MIYHDLSSMSGYLYWENFGKPFSEAREFGFSNGFPIFPHQFSPLNVYPNNDLMFMSNPRSWVHNFCGSAMVNQPAGLAQAKN
jgi:hypothetical protein